MKKWTRNWVTPAKVLLAGVGISTMAFLAPLVISAQPPANAVIGNQAGATYKDASGKDQTALSNLVTTTVTQVVGVTLTNDNSKSVAAGNTAYMPHSVTNTGNGDDTFKITVTDVGSKFKNVVVYPDANGTGVPSGPALCDESSTSGTPPKCSTAGFLQSVPAGQTYNFVVAYTVPATASASTPFDTATVTAASQATPSTLTGTKTATRTDTVNVTADAAFAANKAIKAPAVAAAATGTWPTAVTTGKTPQNGATCSTAWSSTLVSSNPNCTYTVYTISYTNTGGNTGNFSMQDVIGTGATAGLTYVTGSAVWSGAGGTALSESGTTTGTGSSQVKSSWDAVSKTFKATVTNVAPNVSGTISFVALVNSNATVGTGATNNVASYWTTTCDSTQPVSSTNCSNTSTPPSTTNPSPLPVNPTYAVVAGNSSTATGVDSAVPAKTGENLVKQDPAVSSTNTVAQGGTAAFADYVINKGTGTDTFNVSLAPLGANNNFPAGTTFAFFKEDGVTPLTDSNNDGVVDTGPLAAGAFVKIVVKATIPSSAAVAASTPADVLLTAVSTSDPSKMDYVWNEIAGIVAPTSRVDLTNTSTGGLTSTNGGTTTTACTAGLNCDQGQGPSQSPTFTNTTTPGVTTKIPVYIKNNDGTDTTYNLTPTVPPGWTVTLTAGSTCPGTPISSVQVTAATPQVMLTACVTPPVGTPAGTTPIDITATKANDPTVTDTLRDAVTVTLPTSSNPGMKLGPDGGNTNVNNGGTVDQPTTVTNTGGTTCGAGGSGLTAKVQFDSASATAGWQAVLFYDKNTNGIVDAGDMQLSTLAGSATDTYVISDTTLGTTGLIPLAVGAKLPLVVKMFAPQGATNGSVGTVTVTVHDTNATTASACPDTSATYTSTVLASQLRVTKTQAYNEDCLTGTIGGLTFKGDPVSITPDSTKNQCIVYKVVAENQGGATVTNVTLNDVVPAYTTYTAATGQPTAANQCSTANGTVGTVTLTAPSGSSNAVSCGTATSIPPLGTMTMMFSVTLQK